MDTVSIIRGKLGRPALKEEEKTYFFNKRETISKAGRINQGQALPFDFTLEATEPGEHLVDAYIGVEFSFVYEVIITLHKGGKILKGEEKFYCSVPCAGIDQKYG